MARNAQRIDFFMTFLVEAKGGWAYGGDRGYLPTLRLLADYSTLSKAGLRYNFYDLDQV